MSRPFDILSIFFMECRGHGGRVVTLLGPIYLLPGTCPHGNKRLWAVKVSVGEINIMLCNVYLYSNADKK